MSRPLSIIVPTYRRHDLILPVVSSIVPQMAECDELIVVDQVTDNNRYDTGRLRKFPNVICITIFRPNLPNARNEGIRRAQNDCIVFIDDDAVLCEGCLECHRDTLGTRDVGIVAGRINQKAGSDWPGGNRVAFVDRETGEAIGNFDHEVAGEVEYASGGNFSIRREMIRRIGGFNPRFRGNGLFEDVEFSLRARRAGYHVWYEPGAAIDHFHTETGGCQEKSGAAYLLDRLHNHALFCLLHLGPVPSGRLLLYLRNLIEYISRSDGGGHSAAMLIRCAASILRAVSDAVSTRFVGNAIKETRRA